VTTPDVAMLEVMELRGALALAEKDVELRAELAGAGHQVAALEVRLAVMAAQLEDTRTERDDWRERHDAREAELVAVRAEKGLPWWRRLLGTSLALESSDN